MAVGKVSVGRACTRTHYLLGECHPEDHGDVLSGSLVSCSGRCGRRGLLLATKSVNLPEKRNQGLEKSVQQFQFRDFTTPCLVRFSLIRNMNTITYCFS